MDRKEVLDAAAKACLITRSAQYSHPKDAFFSISKLWNTWYGIRKPGEFNAVDVAMMLAMVKQARLSSNPTHEDSWIDLAGYAACGGEVATQNASPSR